ncbi:hypothetical protein Rcae01_05312 [Novipirellula caenicola]|uniref:Uncharacterized protein n=1 Tax=Novipirellula caenicola TaxID=1536901 RepID=A0ABP9VXF7_9BACT
MLGILTEQKTADPSEMRASRGWMVATRRVRMPSVLRVSAEKVDGLSQRVKTRFYSIMQLKRILSENPAIVESLVQPVVL